QALLVEALEVHFGQMQWRQRSAVDEVGHVGAQVRVQHGGAYNAQQRIQLLVWNIGSLEDAGLGGLDQIQHLVVDAGGNRNGHRAFVNAFGQTLTPHVYSDFDGGSFLFKEDLRCIGHLERDVLDIGALQGKAGIRVLLV